MKSGKENISIYQRGSSENIPLVFVHGFPFDHHMWDNAVEYLGKDFYCITYDIRGLGSSASGDGQFTMESFVDDLEFVFEKLKLDKPVLCGLSMGGYISLRAVERMEGKLRGLILCDTKSEADTNQAKIKRAEGIKIINQNGVQKFIEDFVPACFTEKSIQQLPAYKSTLKRSLKSDPTGVKGCLLAMQGRTDTTPYLNKIKIPVLVICGEEDKFTPPDLMKKLVEKISSSKFVVIPNAAHMTPLENPGYFNKAITEFLNNLKK